LNQVWDGENILLEMSANIVEAVYTLEPTMYGNLISQSTPSDDLYYIFDGLGSTAFLWTGSGQNAGQYYYDAFGNVLDGSRFYATNAFQYIGRFGYYTETPDLGTYFLRARMYDPTTGRFLSRDPVGFAAGDPNLYRYVANSPLLFVDPSGLQLQDHHWFPKELKAQIKGMCKESVLNINDFTTPLESGYVSGLKPGTPHYWVTFTNGYNGKVQGILNSSKDCCDFVNQMLALIWDTWDQLQKLFDQGLFGAGPLAETFSTNVYKGQRSTTEDFLGLPPANVPQLKQGLLERACFGSPNKPTTSPFKYHPPTRRQLARAAALMSMPVMRCATGPALTPDQIYAARTEAHPLLVEIEDELRALQGRGGGSRTPASRSRAGRRSQRSRQPITK
jgi:RHS repeat-associated protein